MAFLKRYLIELISHNDVFCNFCFKNIKENSYFFNDEVMFENNVKIKITNMIISLLGFKYINLCGSGMLCQQCTSTLINTYKFIQMCKNNTELMYNTIQSIENSLSVGIEDKDFHKSLFISINTHTNSSRLLYDSKTSENVLTALKRLEILVDNVQQNSYSELDSFDTCFKGGNEKTEKVKSIRKMSTKGKSVKVKKRLNKKIKKIPLKEIIFDINNLSIFKCKICLNSYPNLCKLKQHYQRIHAPKKFKCPECSRSYGSAALLTRHKNDSHRLFICSHCGKSYTSRLTFKTHIQSHELHLICQLCGKDFNNKRNFKNHLKLNICDLAVRRISLEKKFVCDYCNKRYSNKHTLRTHITFEHGKGAVHMCSWCNKKFNALSRLTAHVVTHTQEKKFSCDVCGGKFVTKESLRYHTRIHTGERPYQCEYCEQRFLSSSRRAEHVRRHHKDPMVDCDICHSKFRSQSCLTRHKKRHFNPNSRLYYTRLMSEDKEI